MSVARTALVALTMATCSLAQTTGAIHTTTSNGAVVDGNLYSRDRDVYLAAGPGPRSSCAAPGLPDGRYYFQVTDPSGGVLLSLDAIHNREVVVQGGVIRSHVTGTHRTGNGPCGSRVVQLIPFAATPNAGGEYKAWLTPVAAYDPAGSGFHGFHARASKTDNFKLRTGRRVDQSVITGYKFFDHSEDGVWNPGVDLAEVPIGGWRIEILRNGVLDDVTYTDESGRYSFLRNRDGSTWTIREIAPGGFMNDLVAGARWLATTPRSGTVVTDQAEVRGPDFGNLSFDVRPGVGRTKGFWHNQNGRDLLAPRDPQWRDALTVRLGQPVCLRHNISSSDPQVSAFAPLQPPVTFGDAHADFANWIVGNPALGHAAFMLSTQVAATILNKDFGYMQFTAYVDRFQNGVLYNLDDFLVMVSINLLCPPEAGLTGPNDSAQALRAMILGCLNEFDSINSTGDLSAPQIVYGPTSSPKSFASPYVERE